MNADLTQQRDALVDAVTRFAQHYREVNVMMIGGGTEEIMKELAARQLGL